jgi:hypothetical protein
VVGTVGEYFQQWEFERVTKVALLIARRADNAGTTSETVDLWVRLLDDSIR